MKKEKNSPVSKEKKSVPGSDPENKLKKGTKSATAASVDNIITPATAKVKAKSGRGLANEGTAVSYDEERK